MNDRMRPIEEIDKTGLDCIRLDARKKTEQLTTDSRQLNSRDVQREEGKLVLLKPEHEPPQRGQQKILILQASPEDLDQLRFDEEIRDIGETMRSAENRDQFLIETSFAVRMRDVRRALLDHDPNIVHFIGHSKKNALAVESQSGDGFQNMHKDAAAGLFGLLKDNIDCVVFNSCYSGEIAEAINNSTDCYAIGSTSAITDKQAIQFATSFYKALGEGKNFTEAFTEASK